MVEDILPLPIPEPTKTTYRLQQSTINNSFYLKLYKPKLIGLLETQKEEILKFKKLIYSKVK